MTAKSWDVVKICSGERRIMLSALGKAVERADLNLREQGTTGVEKEVQWRRNRKFDIHPFSCSHFIYRVTHTSGSSNPNLLLTSKQKLRFSIRSIHMETKTLISYRQNRRNSVMCHPVSLPKFVGFWNSEPRMKPLKWVHFQSSSLSYPPIVRDT